MNSLYVAGVAIVLTLAALTMGRRMGSKRFPIYVYIIGVAIVWAVILCATYFFGRDELFHTLTLVCGGYALGMLAMYIAMHVYKS